MAAIGLVAMGGMAAAQTSGMSGMGGRWIFVPSGMSGMGMGGIVNAGLKLHRAPE